MRQTGNGGNDEQYIGDGVYASHDGYHIWLKTERCEILNVMTGEQRMVVHEIALEPSVLRALEQYEVNVREKYNGEKI